MKWKSDYDRQLQFQFEQLQNLAPQKSFRTLMGFETMASGRASGLELQCCTNRVTKTHMLLGNQFIEFTFTRERHETWIEVNLNYKNTDEMEMYVIILIVIEIKQLKILTRKKKTI